MDQRIEERMEEIESYFNRLEEVEGASQEVAREESMENLVRKIVSAAIDIASRIIALEGEGRPESYAEYFEGLEGKGVIDEELSDRLQEMARFRNLIVHQYYRIDNEELEKIIQNDLQDVNKFLTRVREYYG